MDWLKVGGVSLALGNPNGLQLSEEEQNGFVLGGNRTPTAPP
jgi:hypothetical protein